MRTLYALAVITVLGAMLAAPRAAAQRGPEEGVPSEELVADWQLGPFYARPSFEISQLGYDSNPFNRVGGQSDLAGDFIPGIRLALPFGDNLLSIEQKVGYSYFQDQSERRHWSFLTDIGLDFLLGPLRVELHEAFARTDQVYGVELLSRPLRRDNVFRADLASDREASGYIEGSFGHRIIRFDEDDTLLGSAIDLLYDRTVIDGRFDLFLDLVDPALLLVGGSIERHDFRFGPSDRDGQGYFVYGGLRFSPDGAWTGTVRVGLRQLEIGGDSVAAHDGLGVDGRLAFEVGGDSRLVLSGSHRNTYSEISSSFFAVASRGGVKLQLPLGSLMALELEGELARVEFPTGDDPDDHDGSYDYGSVGVNWLLPFADELIFVIGTGYRDLSSNTVFSYDAYTFTMGLRYGL